MDLWTFNKLAAAMLLCLLVIIGANTVISILYPAGEPGTYQVAEVETDTQATDTASADGAEEEKPAQPEPLPVRLASADPAAGEKTARACTACHSFEEGGPNKVGPYLYGVAGRQVAAIGDFSYSNALTEYGGEWTYERLECFLENPSGCVSGTSMGYAGIKDPQKRADLIAYLASLGDTPPLPEPEQASETASASADDGAEVAAADEAASAADEPAATSDGETETSDGETETSDGETETAKPDQNRTASAAGETSQETEGAETEPAPDAGEAEKTGDQTPETATAGEDADGSTGADAAKAGDTAFADSRFASLLASASASKGESAIPVCSACHTFEEGGPNRIGPNLYGVAGREVASVDGFNYSQALKDYGGAWTYKRLDCYLGNPSECVPGNKMTYAGVQDDKKRADIIAYLASLGDSPPLPESGEETESKDEAKKSDATRQGGVASAQ